jgi:ABC-type dipeptide/oligopeptide/nickel transport system permease subunit
MTPLLMENLGTLAIILDIALAAVATAVLFGIVYGTCRGIERIARW